MKTFGQVLREARKKAGITQRELAARLKREDGRPVDPPYLNAVEHDHRYPPEDYLIEQMAKLVDIAPDVLYFYANRQPPDVKTEADQDRLEAAYRAFRKALGVESDRQAKMKVLRDPLGCPIYRLYFKTEVLDERCERKIADFMDQHCGGFRLPIPTDDLIRMIEADTDDLDMYADLPEEEDGHTDFFADRKPKVKIAKRLSDPRYENRLRMTLGHEYGHVWFHVPLWRKSGSAHPAEPRWTCHRERIVDAPLNDWMEFQAAYIGGALLMPSYSVKLWAGEIAMREAKQPPLPEVQIWAAP